MATKSQTVTAPKAEETAAPFDGSEGVITVEQLRNMASLATMPNAADGIIAAYEDVSETLPYIGKDNLLGQPYCVLGVVALVGAARMSENADDLIFVIGQAVRLDGNGNIVQHGKHFSYNAGDEASVHGQEMMGIMATASPASPVLIRHGLREVPAALGSYYTVRPEASKSSISFFDD